MIGLTGGVRLNQLSAHRDCDPARDLVLQGERVAPVSIESLGPQMPVGLGIDKLGRYADLLARSTDASVENVTHTQFAADLLRIGRSAAIGQCGITRDYEHVRDP